MAANPVVITVKFDVHRLSKNQRLHWRERHRRVEAAKLAARYAWHCAGCPVIDAPVEVSLTVRRARPIDPTNAISGWYACEDALFKAKANGYGVTPDDSAEWLSYLPVQFETGKQWKGQEQVIVSIRPLEAR